MSDSRAEPELPPELREHLPVIEKTAFVLIGLAPEAQERLIGVCLSRLETALLSKGFGRERAAASSEKLFKIIQQRQHALEIAAGSTLDGGVQ